MRGRVAAVALAVLFLARTGRAEVRYSVTDLGDLGQHYAEPFAINESGQVAGVSYTASGQRKAFYWSSAAGMIDLIPAGAPGTFPTGGAFGLNDAGQVVGYIT